MRNIICLFAACAALLSLTTASRAQLDNSPFPTTDPLAQELLKSDVFVGKTLRGKIDSSKLTDITRRSPSGRRLKIAVLHDLPASGKRYGNRGNYTKALHRYLSLGRGTLIIVTHNGVAAATDSLTPRQIGALVKQSSGEIQRDPAQGIASLAGRIDQAVGGRGATRSVNRNSLPPDDGGIIGWLIGIPVVLLGGGLAIWGIGSAKKKQKAMKEAQAPVQQLHSDVLEGISYADSYVDLLAPSDNATAAKQARLNAANLVDQASQFARNAKTPEDYGRAQVLLEQAKQQTTLAKQHIDLSTGGTGIAAAIEGTDYRANPMTLDGKPNTLSAPVVPNLPIGNIPQNERGACFFCSRPSRISDLIPVTIALDGQQRKVLACAEDVQIIQQGAMPSTRTIVVSGQHVPWYRANAYDPYRDYYYGNPYYSPGYGYGYGYGGGGLMEGFLLGSLLSYREPMPYPVFIGNSGMASSQPWMSNDYNTPMDSTGSSDFFGTSGSDFGSSDNSDFGAGDSSGTDNSSDWSSGSSDSGSGWDSGSSDSGGWDSGGSDFGGGDSGGGGDF